MKKTLERIFEILNVFIKTFEFELCLDKQSFRTLLVIDRNRNFNLSSNDVKFYLIDSYYNQVHLKLLPF